MAPLVFVTSTLYSHSTSGAWTYAVNTSITLASNSTLAVYDLNTLSSSSLPSSLPSHHGHHQFVALSLLLSSSTSCFNQHQEETCPHLHLDSPIHSEVHSDCHSLIKFTSSNITDLALNDSPIPTVSFHDAKNSRRLGMLKIGYSYRGFDRSIDRARDRSSEAMNQPFLSLHSQTIQFHMDLPPTMSFVPLTTIFASSLRYQSWVAQT